MRDKFNGALATAKAEKAARRHEKKAAAAAFFREASGYLKPGKFLLS
jgi:hypothetical protein